MDVHSMTPITDTTEHTPKPVKKNAKKHRSPYFLIAPIIAMIALAAIFAAQTFAYFTDSAVSENNRIVTGSLDVSLIEVSDDSNYAWSADPIRIMPAGIYTYGGVGAKNSGTIPIYVRIKTEKTILRSEHEISPGWEDLIVCNFKTDAESPWVYHEGYYYYKFALASEEQTASLFDTVFFSPDMGNEFKNSSIQFKLICQSVQADSNSPDPTTAWGWPEDDSASP